MKSIDLTGHVFGLLTVLGKASSIGTKSMWKCKCECGKEAIKWMGNLRNGRTQSCGHLRSEVTTKNKTIHGMYGTPEHKSWSMMLTRCENKANHKYESYGARGIKVCTKWHDFAGFYEDMGPRPAGTSLGRIDNDGNYEKSNCEWQSAVSQARNKSNTALFTFQGVTATVYEHCERLNLLPSTVKNRLYSYKWPVDKAFSMPSRPWGGRPPKQIKTLSQPA